VRRIIGESTHVEWGSMAADTCGDAVASGPRGALEAL
jgi:hypothetical protein